MAWDNIPRIRSFSLGDFHDFDRCVFRFFVNHHLQKKYELAEGSPAQAIGCLLDLAIKKLHAAKAYNQPVDYLTNIVKAAAVDIKTEVKRKGRNSFYGAQAEFVTADTVQKAAEIFKNYYFKKMGRIKKMIVTRTLQRKPFWQMVIRGDEPFKLWGGPDSIEMGEDGIPEIVDYKYLEKGDGGTTFLDMDLMPKLYTLLPAAELQDLGYQTARFILRLWHDPDNNSFYEEFDLKEASNLEAFFAMKMAGILRTNEPSFCNKDYCRACSHSQKAEWIKVLQGMLAKSDLPF